MASLLFRGGTIILPDRLVAGGEVETARGRIAAVRRAPGPTGAAMVVNLNGAYLSPGFVDLHVHGGAGADFMDGKEDAFRAVCRAHARHGTTSLLPTTTVARREQHRAFLDLCRRVKAERGDAESRVLGAHFYGPYFAAEARGCHPAASIRPPLREEYIGYLDYADCITTATVAPELPGA